MKNKKIKYICILIFLVLCGVFYTMSDSNNIQNLSISGGSAMENAKEPAASIYPKPTEVIKKSIYVYVCGAVANPGVYKTEEDARVYQVIQMAGGILPEGAKDYVNQAAAVMDGEQLYVPFQSEVETSGTNLETQQEGESGVNINTAGLEELMTLPGIGESKAQAIIQYREEHGAFQNIEELTNISGIKSGVYEKIKELVRIR